MSEAAWRRRFRAARVTLPVWARDEPNRLLYASNASGKWELYAWDLAAGSHRQVTDRPEGTTDGQLEPGGDRLWWFDDDRGSELGVWRVEPFDGKGVPQPAASSLAPAYSVGLALAKGFAVVGRAVDDSTTVHAVADGDGPRLLYEHREDAAVAGLSRDEGLLCISHSEHGDSRHPALRVITLDGESVADLWDGPELGLTSAGWSPVEGDRRLLVIHERADQPRPMIWRPETGETRELDIDLPGEIGASWYPDGTALLLLHDHRARVELFRFDLDSGSLEPLGNESGSVGAGAVRPDDEVWYSWSSGSTPHEVRTGSTVRLRPPGERSPGGAPYEEHDVDGVAVWVAKPNGSSASGPFPVLFSIHGGPTWHDRDEFSPRVQAFVDHGFAVVLVNYRGSTGYGRAWRDALEGNPGLTELEDIAKTHDWVVRQPWADPGRVVLSGASWGGYLTLLGLGTQPERWSLGMAGVPVADYVAAYEDEMEPLKAFDRSLFGGSPDEVPAVYERGSPITYVERVAVPVLVLAGENDPRCPIRQIDNYLARLDELGTMHEVYRYEAGHGSMVVDEVLRQTEVQLDFAARHVGTRPPD